MSRSRRLILNSKFYVIFGKPSPLWGEGDEAKTWLPAFQDDDKNPTFLFIDDIPKVGKATDGKFWDDLRLKEFGKVWASEN